MKNENLVVNLELSKKIKKLEIFQESYFEWQKYSWGWQVAKTQDHADQIDYVAAYTVTELGEMLSKINRINFAKAYLDAMHLEVVDVDSVQMAHNLMTQPDISALMLIYLKNNKLI